MSIWESLKRIYPYVKTKKMLIIGFIITSIISAIGGILDPWLFSKIVTAISNINISELWFWAIISLICFLIIELAEWLNNIVNTKLQNQITFSIGKDVSKNLFKLETAAFDKNGTGFFIDRLKTEPATMTSSLILLRYEFLKIITGGGVLIYMFFINYFLAFYLLFCSIVVFLLNYIKSKINVKLKAEENHIRENDTSIFNEIIRGIRDIKLLNFKDNMFDKAEKSLNKLINIQEKRVLTMEKFYYIIGNTRTIFDFLLIVIGIFMISKTLLSAENFLIFYLFAPRVYNFINAFSKCYHNLKEYQLSTNRLYEVIDGKKFPYETFGDKNITKLKGYIVFDQVSFSYNKKEVLKNVSFSIKPKEIVGIVGKTGSGKSTIINLLAKNYSVKKGNIYIDNSPINSLNENTIRKNISVINQNPYIFNFSVLENIKIVNPNISNRKLKEITKKLCIDEFVYDLENGYDTIIGEGGVTLSGGQKQRIAIARALIKVSPILLLDEATSALDNETQRKVMQALKELKEDRTIIVIAHRLSTIKDCDKIIVMDKGEIVGIGTHEELMEENKLYQKLYQEEEKTVSKI